MARSITYASSAAAASVCMIALPTPSWSTHEPLAIDSHMSHTAEALDTVVTAETPEGIIIELRPAGVTARFYAFALDLLIRTAVLITLGVVIGSRAGIGTAAYLISWFLLEWFYPVVFELSAW